MSQGFRGSYPLATFSGKVAACKLRERKIVRLINYRFWNPACQRCCAPAKRDVVWLLAVTHVEEDVEEVVSADAEQRHVVGALHRRRPLRVVQQRNLLLTASSHNQLTASSHNQLTASSQNN